MGCIAKTSPFAPKGAAELITSQPFTLTDKKQKNRKMCENPRNYVRYKEKNPSHMGQFCAPNRQSSLWNSPKQNPSLELVHCQGCESKKHQTPQIQAFPSVLKPCTSWTS